MHTFPIQTARSPYSNFFSPQTISAHYCRLPHSRYKRSLQLQILALSSYFHSLHQWHPTLSPLYDHLDHTNQIFAESVWHLLSTDYMTTIVTTIMTTTTTMMTVMTTVLTTILWWLLWRLLWLLPWRLLWRQLCLLILRLLWRIWINRTPPPPHVGLNYQSLPSLTWMPTQNQRCTTCFLSVQENPIVTHWINYNLTFCETLPFWKPNTATA